jgi:DNA polymerase-3 subunit gamma/tau
VRQLAGAAPSTVLEEVMQAVARSSSEEVLRLVDRLIGEGHSPTHFARQMVRFLRNTVVARIAGGDSSLLQISGDERQRVVRVAELFSEEDLTRHLQIMLRTHAELGYRQEQRFHLELGLLKMTHAQRLLPIEQLLSDAGMAGPSGPRATPRPTVVPDARKSESTAAVRSNQVSPFAADSARKSGSKPQLLAESYPAVGAHMAGANVATANVIMGSAAPSIVAEAPASRTVPAKPENIPEKQQTPLDDLRGAVLNALAAGGHQMLVSMLDGGEWRVEGNELVIKVASSPTVIDMTLGADARRLTIATASGAAGRALKLKVIPGEVAPGATLNRPSANGSGRGRAEQDPIVRRMKEKFGAEIRTIIDYKEKR